jgi:hypothetical protein
MRSVTDQILKALLDVDLRSFVSDASSRFLGLLQARSVLARHRSEKTTPRSSQVLDQQAMSTLAVLSGVARTADIENQPIETLQTRFIWHYLIPAGTDFVRSTDFS